MAVSTADAQRRRAAVMGLLVVVAGVAVATDSLHEWMTALVTWAQGLIARAPVAGMVAFVALSAFSAMFAFLSSGVLAPVAIAAWGTRGTLALLWLGWLLGGALTYVVGRYLGRSAAGLFVSEERLRAAEAYVRDRTHIGHVLLFQLAMPSEILGYVLGVVRYSFASYMAVLAVSELPYAVAVVYLGASFLEGRAVAFVLVGLSTIAASAALYLVVRRRGGLSTSTS